MLVNTVMLLQMGLGVAHMHTHMHTHTCTHTQMRLPPSHCTWVSLVNTNNPLA